MHSPIVSLNNQLDRKMFFFASMNKRKGLILLQVFSRLQRRHVILFVFFSKASRGEQLLSNHLLTENQAVNTFADAVVGGL